MGVRDSFSDQFELRTDDWTLSLVVLSPFSKMVNHISIAVYKLSHSKCVLFKLYNLHKVYNFCFMEKWKYFFLLNFLFKTAIMYILSNKSSKLKNISKC